MKIKLRELLDEIERVRKVKIEMTEHELELAIKDGQHKLSIDPYKYVERIHEEDL